MISISGYGVSDIRGKSETVLSVINQAGTGSVSDLSLQEMLMRLFLTLSPLLTPIFGLGLLIGVILWIKNRDHLGYIFLAGFLGILPWIRSGVPKFIITILPVLVTTFLFGMNAVLTYINNKRYKYVAFGVLVLVLLFSWFIGIQVNRYGTAWGPGFELKPYSYPEVDGMKFSVTLGPGMAFPTPEGPRALYGHGYVLFHDWKDFAMKRSNERQLVIDTAMRLNIPLLTTAWSPDYYLDSLYTMGYQTSDPQSHAAPDDFFIERSFTNSQGNTTSVIYSIDEGSDFPELILHLQNYPDTSKIVIIGYPQTLRSFYKNYPEALEYIGPTSAILDLSQLQ